MAKAKAKAKAFEEFDPLFGETKPELLSGAVHLRPSLYCVRSPVGASELEIIVSDFHSLTWLRVFNVLQLEDLKSEVGFGGSLSEFVGFIVASISSGDVKLLLGGLPNLALHSGITYAKLIAQKSKGLPSIPLSLNKLLGSPANVAMASLSQELYQAFRTLKADFVKEQKRSMQLSTPLTYKTGASYKAERCPVSQNERTPVAVAEMLQTSATGNSGMANNSRSSPSKDPRSVTVAWSGTSTLQRWSSYCEKDAAK